MEKNAKTTLVATTNKTEEGAKGAIVINGVNVAKVTHQTLELPKVEQATPSIPSIEELQARAEKTAQLVRRYQNVKEKKAEVDSFVILHESEQASITICDVKGREITTNNPKSIAQVIEIWKADIGEALARAEQEIRDIMNAQATTPDVLKQAA